MLDWFDFSITEVVARSGIHAKDFENLFSCRPVAVSTSRCWPFTFMKYRNEITQEELKSSVLYIPETGFFWRYVARTNTYKRAGYTNPMGYIEMHINGFSYLAHRLAWLYVHGNHADEHIDHINNDAGDNRIANLRVTSQFGNTKNMRKGRRNTSGHKGVSWNSLRKKWVVHIMTNRHNKNWGSFDSLDEAACFARMKREELHGEFANHG